MSLLSLADSLAAPPPTALAKTAACCATVGTRLVRGGALCRLLRGSGGDWWHIQHRTRCSLESSMTHVPSYPARLLLHSIHSIHSIYPNPSSSVHPVARAQWVHVRRYRRVCETVWERTRGRVDHFFRVNVAFCYQVCAHTVFAVHKDHSDRSAPAKSAQKGSRDPRVCDSVYPTSQKVIKGYDLSCKISFKMQHRSTDEEAEASSACVRERTLKQELLSHMCARERCATLWREYRGAEESGDSSTPIQHHFDK